ncbi:hypothetical protein [Elizabethkingia anophelis]|uniref:hypothetical protein n=1 Tax=Elizabethkingia anophelis TaxID=1117645 RepID=UPI0007515A87|nr:hypothetical protein [Elizabethkingia anophelis]KUY30690.1 hypothetical protein ATB96_12365 [Elizabethkingia ursingii]EHM7983036.1 hypothetical protein [Elizabethkingia anophelis]EHM8030258.1 hypothetical protein [Elizabethkingia anophelis]EHZ9533012.1 hypothetical protein [Elizabethkingia anophelis]EKU3670922.1 hypothetical protein [Elizabethkingia anophelis]
MIGAVIFFLLGALLFYLRIKNKFPYNLIYDKNDENDIYDFVMYKIPGWTLIIIMILGGLYGIIVNLLKII